MNELKLALITGSSQGLGLEITKLLLNKNWKVFGIDLEPSAINHQNYTHLTFNLLDIKNVLLADLIKTSKLDLVIHNAGHGYYGDFANQDQKNLLDTIYINLIAPILLTKKALSFLNKNAQIIFIGSASSFLPAKKHEIYGASKSGINGFARSLRRELDSKIRVRVYHPGPMKTNFHKKVGFTDTKDSFQSPDKVAKHFTRWLNKTSWKNYSQSILRPTHKILTMAPTLPFHFTNLNRDKKLGLNALITGGSRGLGFELTKVLSNKHYHVTNISRKPCTISKVNNLTCDLSNAHDIQDTISRLSHTQPLELVILNAGFNKASEFENLSEEDILKMIYTNFSTQALLVNQLMAKKFVTEDAHFIFISSLSHQLGYPYSAVYAATKDAITHFARSLRLNYPQNHFQVIFPGPLETDMAKENSPRKSKKARFSTKKAAQIIYRSYINKKLEVSPGLTSTTLNYAGRIFPNTMDLLMKKALKPKKPF